MANYKLIHQGVVLDSDDPLRLGRLRVLEDNYKLNDIKETIVERCKSGNVQNSTVDIETGIKNICKWTKDDPFVIVPLLPFTLSITPKKGELVNIIYSYTQNPSSQTNFLADRNRFYVPVSPSTPLSVVYENSTASKTNTLSGDNYKQQKNLKEVNGEISRETFGVFPEPDDNSLVGRGSADLILKEDTVLLRAGKTNDLVGPTTNLPTANYKRAFVELTRFNTKKLLGGTLNQDTFFIDVKQIKYLIEYHLYNPENEMNNFRGYINLYKFNTKPNPVLNYDSFKINTDVDSLKGSQLPISFEFNNKTLQEVIDLINNFIRGLNNDKIVVENHNPNTFTSEEGKQFPFVYRPSPATYNNMISAQGNPFESNNLYTLFQSVNINDGSNSFGFGIVTAKNLTGPILKIKKTSYQEPQVTSEPITYGVMGAQKLYLISHDSSIGVNKINLRDTVYGISQDKYNEIESKTEPLMRGEKTLDLMNLIVKFLLSHVHPYHGLPPVPVGQDGTKSEDILQKLLDAPNTILNQNIRIN